MNPSVHIGSRCDHGCPAPAVHLVIIHGQDFSFCNHHTAEVNTALGWDEPADTVHDPPRRKPVGTAGASRP